VITTTEFLQMVQDVRQCNTAFTYITRPSRNYGEAEGEGMIDRLRQFINKYNEECGEKSADLLEGSVSGGLLR